MLPIDRTRGYELNWREFTTTLSRLLANYAHYTRELMLFSIIEDGNTEAVQQKLRSIAEDLARLVNQLYGEVNASRLEGILNVRNALVLEMFNAIRANDTRRIEELNTQWYAIADNLAQFISTLNSGFDQNVLQADFYDLIYMTENEAVQIFSGNYMQSIQQYEQIVDRIQDLTQDIVNVIMRQLQI